ncbi:hypothetical protein J7E97_15915 [Streptomyces sp. ISL-66]|uniref:hypothetical protein n=1 Tax=Streptomyces sp. ISL-66 TaxID=2819186 RepID=UPI001BE645BB|nr:hypothetical protein [Streptomyces sp. ISL-66]MBT2469322.1 hypothetical protein [Streptomyces sp. ISL-66]
MSHRALIPVIRCKSTAPCARIILPTGRPAGTEGTDMDKGKPITGEARDKVAAHADAAG